MPMTTPIVGSRSEWLEAVAARCQLFVGVVMRPDDMQSIPELASSLVGDLPDAVLPVDDLILTSILLGVARKWGTSLHDHAHGGSSDRRCALDLPRTLMLFVDGSVLSASMRFVEWARTFSIEFSRWHPVSAGRRAAAIIRERRGERVDTVALARQIGVSPQHLRRDFRRSFGVSLARYQRHAQLLRALEVLCDQPGKIEPIALQAGYASKKSFYDVFKRTLGMTPTQFQQLPQERARQLIESAGNQI
jgi:AraC-like DNA-binding protein